MAKVHAYLNFNGNCEEAFMHYEKVFNTKIIGISRFGDMPVEAQAGLSDADKNKIMNTGIFINESTMLMGSDVIEGFGHALKSGNNTYVMLEADTIAEAEKLYNDLSKDALNMEMTLQETFFAERYSAFTDTFGIPWMIYYGGSKS